MILNAMPCLFFLCFYELEEFNGVFEFLFSQEGILN